MLITIHVNPSQAHQREHGRWLTTGFEKHGIKSKITFDPCDQKGDIHIISGPHFAKRYWLGHPRIILLDRAYYKDGPKPDGMVSMPYVSLGWMRGDGGRSFRAGTGRLPIIPRYCKAQSGTLFLADYDGPIEHADTIRYHPAIRSVDESLIDCIQRHKTAIGYQTTALVTAALEGLEIICKDERNILSEPSWKELLPWADWHWSEIESGDAWEHLSKQL